MKGIVFTELLELIEEKWGYEMVDDLLSETKLASGGVYTAVGTYEFNEMQSLLVKLSEKTGLSIPQLLQAYAHYFSGHMISNYGQFFEKANDCFDFLGSIHNYIHVEVKKLYPDAELPHFETNQVSPQRLEMIYTSKRKMGHFALGLIEKSAEYFKEDIDIQMTNMDMDGEKVQFILTKK